MHPLILEKRVKSVSLSFRDKLLLKLLVYWFLSKKFCTSQRIFAAFLLKFLALLLNEVWSVFILFICQVGLLYRYFSLTPILHIIYFSHLLCRYLLVLSFPVLRSFQLILHSLLYYWRNANFIELPGCLVLI